MHLVHGAPKKLIDLTGALCAIIDECDGKIRPALFTLEDRLFLPVFSTIGRLEAAMKLAGQTYAKVKQITDGLEFLDSVAAYPVMFDPEATEQGTTRFTLVTTNNHVGN